MAGMTIKIYDKNQKLLKEAFGEKEVTLVYEEEYKEGDYFEIETEEKNCLYYMQLDDAKGKSLVYLTGNVKYTVPFGEKRANISQRVFQGTKHLLSLKKAIGEEKEHYRLLSENVWDQHGEVNCYPHASANVETRGETVFAALNAIDGIIAVKSHGEWPYQSWGINRREDAVWKLEFGRPVEIEQLVIYTRADFPHDNWWERATVLFSDGSKEILELKKGGEAQNFQVHKENIEWLTFGELKKADDPSPFPALTQFQVYGRG